MNNSDNMMLRPHKIVLEDDKATIHIDAGNHILLKVHKDSLKAPMRAVFHFEIGMVIRCLRNNLANKSKLHDRSLNACSVMSV